MPDGLRPTFFASQHKPDLEFCYSTVQSQKNPSSSCKPLTVPKKLSKILRFWTVFIGLNNFYNLYIDLFQERKSSKHPKKFHFRISQNIHLYVQDKKKKVDASCFLQVTLLALRHCSETLGLLDWNFHSHPRKSNLVLSLNYYSLEFRSGCQLQVEIW